MKTLNEYEAWLYVADLWINNVVSDRHRMPYVYFTHIRAYGLCDTLYDMESQDLITIDTFRNMREKLSNVPRTRGSLDGGYCWPRDEEGRQARVAFCEQQVALCGD